MSLSDFPDHDHCFPRLCVEVISRLWKVWELKNIMNALFKEHILGDIGGGQEYTVPGVRSAGTAPNIMRNTSFMSTCRAYTISQLVDQECAKPYREYVQSTPDFTASTLRVRHTIIYPTEFCFLDIEALLFEGLIFSKIGNYASKLSQAVQSGRA